MPAGSQPLSQNASPPAANPAVLLEARQVVKTFPRPGGLAMFGSKSVVHAVSGVSFHINRGETLGLVGESGCGKSTVGHLILRLLEPDSGSVFFEGKNIYSLPMKVMRRLRKDIQIVFQDPYESLNPRMTAGEIVAEPMELHHIAHGGSRDWLLAELFDQVGLGPHHIRHYPHEFSGGQRQRIGIARALAVRPKLIVCDEPVSALDVSIQAQIINLLQDIQQSYRLTYLFISHDLSVVRHISQKIAVMYLGKIVEMTGRDELYGLPLHPYTEALLSAISVPDPSVRRNRTILKGDVPSPIRPPSGCRFHTRCPIAQELCASVEPPLIDVGENHYVACHFRKQRKPTPANG